MVGATVMAPVLPMAREWHSAPVQSLAELKTKELIMGAQAPGSSQVDFPLLANPDLLDQFYKGANRPENPCSFCSLCCASTAVFPLGCYDQDRFKTPEGMINQILAWCSPNAPFSIKDGSRIDKDAQELESLQ